MPNLLLEIGTEEIPAGYIAPALAALAGDIESRMDGARISHGELRTMGTPRRLAIIVAEVAPRQKPSVVEVIGPPEQIGYDALGQPTLAAEKFAAKVGVKAVDLDIKTTPKGRYLYAVKTETESDSGALLRKILPEAILATPFPKTMRWAAEKISFARPIHSLVAILGSDVLQFKVGNVKSGSTTRGHRFMHPGPVKITEADQYVASLKAADVWVDVEERRRRVRQAVEKAAQKIGGEVLKDEALLETVTNLVEYPVADAGCFGEAFLKLPREILITAMREHQKYFAVVDDKNNLMPHFIAVNNTRATDMALVVTGHERVLRARLADAQFFFEMDRKEPFDTLVERLRGVRFQAELGSVYEKVARTRKLAGYLVDTLDRDDNLKKHVLRAARLCKADLISQVVVEFPKLQGVMGRVYAALGGEADEVAAAIEEHYRPTYSGGPLPVTPTGAILSVADKIDTICGCFGVGLIPTGGSDPYALRRQGIGIIQIMVDRGFDFSLKGAVEQGLKMFGARSVSEIETSSHRVMVFLTTRIMHLLHEEGYTKDVVAAVLAASADNMPDVWRRVRALQTLKSAPGFEPLAAAFKRVVNIIRQASDTDPRAATAEIDAALFAHEAEAILYESAQEVEKQVQEQLAHNEIDRALMAVAGLRGAVDAFFEGVMVLSDKAPVRANRLALLQRISALFARFADFSKITT